LKVSPVSEEKWEQLAREVQAAVTKQQQQQQQEHGSVNSSSSSSIMPSHFEAVTAMALKHFADEQVDLAVIETGLGGATDATNVFSPEQLQTAVITAIGFDHLEALGGSLTSITNAKAGIMKPGVPVVVGPQQQTALLPAAATTATAAENGSSSWTPAAADQQQQQQQRVSDVVWKVLEEAAAGRGMSCPLVKAEEVVQVCQ
jgi:folylpolyglutamate synthase/dihydrofolate synthase